MSKSHTPGPWSYDPELAKVYSAPTNLLVASVAIAGNTECEAAWPADARLIAAAPELLEALKDTAELARRCMTAHGTDAEFADIRLEKALVAIAKVEGRS